MTVAALSRAQQALLTKILDTDRYATPGIWIRQNGKHHASAVVLQFRGLIQPTTALPDGHGWQHWTLTQQGRQAAQR